MIRKDFTSASIEFWRKHEAEKKAIQKRNLTQGILMVVMFPFIFLILCLVFSNKAHATGLVDLKFGQAQIADSQWNVSACTQTATCQIYSKNPGTVYKIPWTSGQLSWAAGDYVAFVATGDNTNPFNAVQYSANGAQKAVMGTGHIINMGADYFFFVGNDNNTGQLFSMTQGFANTSGVTWTGTLNPTVSQVNTYAANGSTTPLAAGQTAAPPPPPSGPVITNGTFQNAGSGWNIAGSFRSIATGTGHNGSNTLNFGAGSGDVHDTASQTLTGLISGHTYTVSYWVMMGGSSGTYLDAKITRADGSQAVNYTITDQALNTWTQVYLTFVSDGDTYTLTFTSYNDPSLNYISDVSISDTPGYVVGGGFGPGGATPTVVSTSTSDSTSSSSTTTNDFQQTGVTDVTYNNGTISAYTSVVYGTDTTVTTTTTVTPVTTTNWSDGSATYSNGSSSTAVSVVDTYNVWKAYQIPAWSYTIPVVSGNSVYLNQSGSNPNVVVEQVGNRNVLAGINNPSAYLVGNNDTLVVRQAGQDNLTLVKTSGNNNTIQVPQGFHHNWANGAEWATTGSNSNTAMIDVFGNSNNVFVPQEGLRNLATLSVVGSVNNPVLVQYGNDNKSYNAIDGSYNNIGNWQQGNNNLSSINMLGNGNQASITQTGNNNSATLTLINAGGPSSVSVTQNNNGTGAGNLLSVQQQCATLSGCSVTINQNK